MRVVLTVLFILNLTISVLGQPLTERLMHDLADGELNDFTRIQAAFIVSGADRIDHLHQGTIWFESLLDDIKAKNLIGFDRIPSAEKLFLYLHTTWLKDYQLHATTLFDIMERRAFNCVSATVLYNLICDELGLSTEAFETPTHVYTIFSNVGQRVMVENTTSMGFNIMNNLQRYSQYLLQYYPKNEALKIGLDRLYAHENTHGRTINNTELLGLICYNRAVFNAEQKNYQFAYEMVKIAQMLNRDSRSNRRFEISLYYRWGNELFQTKRFFEAFEVMVDAVGRYPDNDDFKRNCQNAFINALHLSWVEKNWEMTVQLVHQIDLLDMLTDREHDRAIQALENWLDYFAINKLEALWVRAKELRDGILTRRKF